MRSFAVRSVESEKLDEDYIPASDLFQNLKELEFINRFLGGHAVTIRGLKKLIHEHRLHEFTLLDVGCGGGDTLRAIARFCRRNGLKARLIGVDLKLDCIEYARSKSLDYPEIEYHLSDFRTFTPNCEIDFVSNALFCHHFYEEDLKSIAYCMHRLPTKGFIVNDLHRHWLAFYSIRILTKLFSKSYLVKNDACLSVARGFRKSELQYFFSFIPGMHVQISWVWAFRWLLIGSMNSMDRKSSS
jgi:2-polyprenyl-3-methyl-5-hydroxy-6-metoxy-1,4-benzoquinol methylase